MQRPFLDGHYPNASATAATCPGTPETLLPTNYATFHISVIPVASAAARPYLVLISGFFVRVKVPWVLRPCYNSIWNPLRNPRGRTLLKA